MALIGIQLNKENPEFTSNDFRFWMPQFSGYLDTPDGELAFTKFHTLANKKVYKSIFGSDWELAMSYCIAHYITLRAQMLQSPAGDSLEKIAGGGTTKGVLTSMTVGDFSKSYDIDKTMSSEDEAKFWNQTSYGTSFWALLKSKPIPSIFVVTSNPLRG